MTPCFIFFLLLRCFSTVFHIPGTRPDSVTWQVEAEPRDPMGQTQATRFASSNSCFQESPRWESRALYFVSLRVSFMNSKRAQLEVRNPYVIISQCWRVCFCSVNRPSLRLPVNHIMEYLLNVTLDNITATCRQLY